jgi:ClpP class serine protease
VMSEDAVLGPVDPQIGEYPAASILRAVARKPIERVSDQMLVLADQADMAGRQLHQNVLDLLAVRMAPERADELAKKLSEGHWTHDYAITASEAREMGLPVSTAIPPDVLRLMDLYPQPLRRRPTVEYLPTPHRSVPASSQGASGDASGT